MSRSLIVLVAATSPALSQPALTEGMGPRLSVPSAETGLFFRTQPVVVGGTILVPQADIDRWLKVSPARPADNELVYTYFGGTESAVRIHLWVGEKRARIAQAEIPLEAAPAVIDGVTYLPFKFMAEALGIWVEPEGRFVTLRKPDLGWVCRLAIPPHPKSLEGKLAALAVARRPDTPKRVAAVALAPDTLSGHVLVAEPSADGKSAVYHIMRYTRDRTGWHFAEESLIPPPPAPGD